jgi:hypothetical protein
VLATAPGRSLAQGDSLLNRAPEGLLWPVAQPHVHRTCGSLGRWWRAGAPGHFRPCSSGLSRPRVRACSLFSSLSTQELGCRSHHRAGSGRQRGYAPRKQRSGSENAGKRKQRPEPRRRGQMETTTSRRVPTAPSSPTTSRPRRRDDRNDRTLPSHQPSLSHQLRAPGDPDREQTINVLRQAGASAAPRIRLVEIR